MAIYRTISMTFWTDSKITDNFTPEDKYFYLYLLTNQLTNLPGCYEISVRRMSVDTGYTQETIVKLIERMEKVHNVIRYDPETKEVLLLNWGKYNWNGSPKLRKSVEGQIKYIKSKEFKEYVTNLFYGKDMVSIPYTYGSDTSVSVSVSVSDSVSGEKTEDIAEENFNKLWELYPRKKGKSGVKPSKKKELLKVGYDKMAKCIELFKKDMAGRDEQYIPYGSTFFNTDYKDYLEKAEKLKQQEKVIDPEDEEPSEEWKAFWEEK